MLLDDGRSELWQWDTGRTLSVDADCSQVHFSNNVFGRSIDVDVVDGAAIIPDILLQTDKDLNVWAFVGTAENGYTKIRKTFKVNRRNKPADYVFTPTEQMTLQMIQLQIGDLADLTTEAKDTLVAAINEAARTGGGAGSMDLRVADGYVQYSADGGMTWTNLIAIADLKGDPGEPGKDGHSPVVTATKSGKTTTISVDGAAIATVEDGADGKPGTDGADGVTPHIGDNGNWYLGETDTGKPSRGADGATGATGATGEKGADGKSAYAYAVEGGYTGTEDEFAAKLAAEKFANPNALTFTGVVTGSYDGSAPLEVNIPQGGGGAWHTIGTQKMDGVETAVYFDLAGETIIQIIVTASWGTALTATKATVSLSLANGETVQFTPQTMNATSFAPKNIFTIFGNSRYCRQMIFSKAEGAQYSSVQGSFGVAYGYNKNAEGIVEDAIATGITITFDNAPSNAAIVKVEGM